MPLQSLLSFYESLFSPLFLRARSPRTKQLYLTTIRNFTRFLDRVPTLDDFSDDIVSRYLSWFRALPRSPYSVNKERDNLLCMWRFAARKRIVEQFPDVKPDTEPQRIPQAWSKLEIIKLFRACKRAEGWIAGVPASGWWLALHHLAWDSGERITALISLTWDNVDLESGWVRMPAETRKGGLVDRQYRISADSIEALKAIENPRRSAVFPWPYCKTYLWNRYKLLLKDSGLPNDRKSMFHRIRKSVASHYEAAGGNATTLLGHSSRKVTEAYIDPRIVSQPQACEKLFRIDND